MKCIAVVTLTVIVAGLAVTVPTVSVADELPAGVQQTYERHKQDLLTKFTDKHGLVVDLNDGKPDGLGDSAFRTGLAALCFALEKDNPNTRKYLTVLHDKCWKDGKPIRHPDVNEPPHKTYSRDQFIPQMTACYFAYQLGDNETKALAKKLYARFVDHAIKNDWVLNQGEAAALNRGNRFPFFEVAESMDLGNRNEFKNDKQFLNRQMFVAAMKAKGAELLVAGDNPNDFYGVHLMFLEAVVAIKTRPQTDGLIDAAKTLGDRLRRHNMAPFIWYREPGEPQLKAWLANWPAGWNRVDYVWQRSKRQQEQDAASPLDKKEYARLDYLLLRRLLEVEIRRD